MTGGNGKLKRKTGRPKAGEEITDKQFIPVAIELDGNSKAIAERFGIIQQTAYQRLQNKEIKQALQQARKIAIESAGVEKSKVLIEIAKLAFSNMQDFTSIDNEGNPYVDLSKITKEQMAAIQEITSETYFEKAVDNEGNEYPRAVKKVKLKLYSKQTALDSLGKFLKLFNDSMSQEDRPVIHMPLILIDSKPVRYDFIDV